MEKPKIERNKILIKDVPYVYIDTSLIQGDIDEVSKNILNLRNILKEAYESRKKDLPFSHTPFEDYKYIHLNVYYDDYFDISLQVFRDESDEEFEKRLNVDNKRSESAKLAAKNRKKAQEKRERTLFENLKKKYG